MSARRTRWLLWSALLVAMPVPLVLVGRGHLPVVALAELALATLAVGVIERSDGTVKILGALLVAQTLVWMVAAWLLAGLIGRGLGFVAPRFRARVTLVLVVLGLAAALLSPLYRSPFHASRARQTLLEVYQ
jgi:hypothetical protein